MAGGRWPFCKGKNDHESSGSRHWLPPEDDDGSPPCTATRGRAIGCTCPSGCLEACMRATSPCHGPMPTSRQGGFSTAGACRFLQFPAKVRSVFRRSCGSAPCSCLTCGMTRRSPAHPRPRTRSGPRNGERNGAPGIWAIAIGTSAGPRRLPTMVAGMKGMGEMEAAMTGTLTMATTTTVANLRPHPPAAMMAPARRSATTPTISLATLCTMFSL
jgi:hypothetical protein